MKTFINKNKQDYYLTSEEDGDLVYLMYKIWLEGKKMIEPFGEGYFKQLAQYSGGEEEDFFSGWTKKIKNGAIVSTPPFSKLDKILECLWEWKQSFMLIVPISILDGKKKFKWLHLIEPNIIIPNYRFKYLNYQTKEILPTPSFKSILIWRDFETDSLGNTLNWLW